MTLRLAIIGSSNYTVTKNFVVQIIIIWIKVRGLEVWRGIYRIVGLGGVALSSKRETTIDLPIAVRDTDNLTSDTNKYANWTNYKHLDSSVVVTGIELK